MIWPSARIVARWDWARAQVGPLGLDPDAAAYLALLARYANREGWAYPSATRVAVETGWSRRQVVRAAERLKAVAPVLGLEVVKPRGRPTRWRLPEAASAGALEEAPEDAPAATRPALRVVPGLSDSPNQPDTATDWEPPDDVPDAAVAARAAAGGAVTLEAPTTPPPRAPRKSPAPRPPAGAAEPLEAEGGGGETCASQSQANVRSPETCASQSQVTCASQSQANVRSPADLCQPVTGFSTTCASQSHEGSNSQTSTTVASPPAPAGAEAPAPAGELEADTALDVGRPATAAAADALEDRPSAAQDDASTAPDPDALEDPADATWARGIAGMRAALEAVPRKAPARVRPDWLPARADRADAPPSTTCASPSQVTAGAGDTCASQSQVLSTTCASQSQVVDGTDARQPDGGTDSQPAAPTPPPAAAVTLPTYPAPTVADALETPGQGRLRRLAARLLGRASR